MNIGITFSQTIMLKNLDTTILLVNNNFNYFVERLFFFILNIGEEDNLRPEIFLLLEIEEIIAICGYMIHMELLELKFCKLDYDTKKSIHLRGFYDSISRIYGDEEEEENDLIENMIEFNNMPNN